MGFEYVLAIKQPGRNSEYKYAARLFNTWTLMLYKQAYQAYYTTGD
jgi:hypothetical protein